MDENGLLTRKVVDGGHKFCTIYLPNVLVFQVLRTAHMMTRSQWIPKNLCSPQKSFLLERHEGRYQKTLQDMSNVHATQVRECQV